MFAVMLMMFSESERFAVQVWAVSPEGHGERSDPVKFWSEFTTDMSLSKHTLFNYLYSPI